MGRRKGVRQAGYDSAAVAAALVLAFVSSCGGTANPPELTQVAYVPPGGASANPSSGVPNLASGSAAPMCNLGSVCACTDQPIQVDPPTLYFVLDRSQSMADDGKWTTVIAVLDKLIIQLGPRAQIAAAVFPPPNPQTGCDPGVEVFAPRVGDTPAGRIGPTSTGLYDELSSLSPLGGTPTADTLRSLTARIEALSGKRVVVLATDGGPNCNPNAQCTAAMCQANIDGDLNCSMTGPSCCTPQQFGPEACLDAQPTIDAVTALASGGVPVYVVGIPGSAPYADLLDSLATAGGTARATEPKYYAVTTPDENALESTLFKIAATVTHASCSLTLDAAPPDPTLVNVFFDNVVVPQAGADGWSLDGVNVTLLGASCQKVLSGDVFDVRVVAGCPSVLK